MPAIGFVTKQSNGSFKGHLKTLSIRAEIEIMPNLTRASDVQPDYRVIAAGADIGGGWIRHSETSGKDYITLALAAPEFGPRRIYTNLGRAAGQSDDNLFALIWTPHD